MPDIQETFASQNAELFEEAFYEKKNLDPQMHVQQENNNTTVVMTCIPKITGQDIIFFIFSIIHFPFISMMVLLYT